jgi:uncharacterized protein with HEPN domain
MIIREKLYLVQLIEGCHNALSFVEGYSKVDFMGDAKTQHAVSMALISIGESSKKLLEKHLEFTQKYPEIEWAKICGQRNRIAHGYHDIDWEVVWKTVCEDLADLEKKCGDILKQL